MNDARLWDPWLRINRLLRVMLHIALERGGVVRRPWGRLLDQNAVASVH